MGIKKSYLIQRLEKPMRDGSVTTPFTFGGGMRDGGIGKEGIDLLRGVWAFDYMGAAEYEFGAVPQALNRIANRRSEFVAGFIQIKPSAIKKSYDKRDVHPTAPGAVFYLAHRDEREYVETTIRQLAKDESKAQIRDYCGLDNALRGGKYAKSGWLELDNGFLFFVDRQMFECAAKLFEIPVQS